MGICCGHTYLPLVITSRKYLRFSVKHLRYYVSGLSVLTGNTMSTATKGKTTRAPSKNKLSSLREAYERYEKTKRDLEELDRVINIRRGKKRKELLKERLMVTELLFSAEREIDDIMEAVKERIKSIHPSFKHLLEQYRSAVTFVKDHDLTLIDWYSEGRKHIKVDRPYIEVNAYWLSVYTEDELRDVLNKLREIAKETGVKIVLMVDDRPDHFPLAMKLLENGEDTLRKMDEFLCRGPTSYVFLIKP